MAIDLSSLSGNLAGRIRTGGSVSGKEEASKSEAQAPNSQGNAKADSVQLSGEATRLNSRVQSAPEIDESKVSAIRSSIEDGSYKVDYQALAKSIIQFENEL